MYKRQGFTESELVRFYCGAIRPVAKYASPALHSMIPTYLKEALERQQTQALKNIFGPGISARKMRDKANLETLKLRREKATLKFAEKAAKSDRFGAWFPRRARAAARRERPYQETTARTERHKNSRVNYMRKILNDSIESNKCQERIN